MIYGIVGLSQNGIIGANGKIPWHYPEDLKFFKERTLNCPIVMGRKTYDSFGGKPLPKRLHLVLTHSVSLPSTNIIAIADKRPAMQYAECMDIYIIGGVSVWHMFARDIQKWLITRIPESPKGDTVFAEHLMLHDFKQIEDIKLDTLTVNQYVRKPKN